MGMKKNLKFESLLYGEIGPDRKYRVPSIYPVGLHDSLKQRVCEDLKKNDVFGKIFFTEPDRYVLEVYPMRCKMFDYSFKMMCTLYFYFYLKPDGVLYLEDYKMIAF